MWSREPSRKRTTVSHLHAVVSAAALLVALGIVPSKVEADTGTPVVTASRFSDARLVTFPVMLSGFASGFTLPVPGSTAPVAAQPMILSNQMSSSKSCAHFGDFCRAVRDRQIVLLAAGQSAALLYDGVTTRQFLNRGYVEIDPFARVFIGRKPTWGRMAPMGMVQVAAEMWLAERMKTSRNRWVRRLWWLPQTIGTSANSASIENNLRLR